MVQRMLGYSLSSGFSTNVGRSVCDAAQCAVRSACLPALCAVSAKFAFLSAHRILRVYANHVGYGVYGVYAIRAAQSAELSDGVPLSSQSAVCAGAAGHRAEGSRQHVRA